MRIRLAHFVFVLFIVLTASQAKSQSATIPPTQGSSLAGTQVMLPEDLRGKVGVLVVGFSKASGDVCKGWGERLVREYRDSHDVTYYQMPVLESVPKLIRGMVVKSIKSGVPEAEQGHFLPVFSNEAVWQKVANYSSADDAYVLVVAGEGHVRWQTSGRVSDGRFAALKQQIEALRGQLTGAGK
jgi:hypothetical protein